MSGQRSDTLYALRRMLDYRNNHVRRDSSYIQAEIKALEYAIGIIEGSKPVHHPPSGLAWDHHEAIHADCEWDWTGSSSYLPIDHPSRSVEMEEEDASA